MKSRRNPFSVFGETLSFSREEIENSCSDALKQSGFMPSEPEAIRIEAFIEKHFQLRIEYRDDLGEGVLGCTQFSRDGKPTRIVIGDGGGDSGVPYERRIRSTTAHEGGHAMLHPLLFMQEERQLSLVRNQDTENIDLAEMRILCRDEDFRGNTGKRYDGRWWEWQANQAIGGFLMPKHLVISAIEEDLESGGITGVATLDSSRREDCARKLADIFDVNPAVARIRLLHLFPEAESGQLTL